MKKEWTCLSSGIEYGTFKSLVKFALKVAKPAQVSPFAIR